MRTLFNAFFVALIALIGAFQFGAWDQVLDLWEQSVAPIFLVGHPHFARYLIVYPGFLLQEQVSPRFGFGLYIALFGAAFFFVWRRVGTLLNGVAPGFAVSLAMVSVFAFMNGRGVIAWLAWMLCVHFCLRFERRMSSKTEGLLYCAGALLLATVSTGVFVVVFLVILHTLFKRFWSAGGGLRRTANMLLGMLAFIYISYDYFVLSIEKNLDFFGGGLAGVGNMLAHGAGRFVFNDAALIAVIMLSPLALGALCYGAYVLRFRGQASYLRLLAFPLAFGFFGFTVMTLILPLLLVFPLFSRKQPAYV